MASVTTRKRNTKWEYRFEGAMIDGKRKQISKSGFRTKADALAAGTKALAEYNSSGLYFEPSEMSMSDFLEEWHKNYCLINLKETTSTKYKTYLDKHIKPALGTYKLKAITTPVIQSFISSKHKDGYARNSIMNMKGVLTNAFDYAIDMNYIINNPATRAKIPSKRMDNSKIERTALTKDEMNRIFDRFPEGHTSYIPLMIAYHCGTRIGETFALTWSDIDLENGSIDINKQIQWINKKWVFTECKYDSKRKVRIDNKLIAALKRYKKRQLESKMFYAEYYQTIYVNDKKELDTSGEPIDMLLRKEDGSYLQSRVMQHTSMVIHKNLGIENFTYHSIRHTHATMLLESGADPKDVQQRLGHANIKMTLDIYAHVTAKMEDRTVGILESIM